MNQPGSLRIPPAAFPAVQRRLTTSISEQQMKELKAYTRSVQIEELVKQLEASGAPGVSVVEVLSEGYGFSQQVFEDGNITPVVKIEIVCRDEQVETLVGVILKYASTGSHGDGRIFIAPVDECVRIRDGKRGQAVL